jgi:hypothetical protein
MGMRKALGSKSKGFAFRLRSRPRNCTRADPENCTSALNL